MADEIVTRQQLVDAGLDAESLQKFISGLDSEDVLTRLGQIYPTLAKLVRMLMETGGWKAYSTEAELLATVPTVNPSVGYAFDTKKLYKWNGTAWIDEGLSQLDQAKNFVVSLIKSSTSTDSIASYLDLLRVLEKGNLTEITGICPFVKNFVMYGDGTSETVANNDQWRAYYVPVKAGDFIEFYGYVGSGKQTQAILIQLDSSKNFVAPLATVSTSGYKTLTGTATQDGFVYVRVRYEFGSFQYTIKIKPFQSSALLKDFDSNVAESSASFLQHLLLEKNGVYLDAVPFSSYKNNLVYYDDGTAVDTSSNPNLWRAYFIPVKAGDIVEHHGWMGGATNYAVLSQFDKSKTFVSALVTDFTAGAVKTVSAKATQDGFIYVRFRWEYTNQWGGTIKIKKAKKFVELETLYSDYTAKSEQQKLDAKTLDGTTFEVNKVMYANGTYSSVSGTTNQHLAYFVPVKAGEKIMFTGFMGSSSAETQAILIQVDLNKAFVEVLASYASAPSYATRTLTAKAIQDGFMYVRVRSDNGLYPFSIYKYIDQVLPSLTDTYTPLAQIELIPKKLDGTRSYNFAAFTQNHMVEADGFQYVVVIAEGGLPHVLKRSLSGGAWDIFDLSTIPGNPFASPNAPDGHNNFAIEITKDGYILITGNHHTNLCRAVRSESPHDISSWLQISYSSDTWITYPRFVKYPDGTVQVFWRKGVSGDGEYRSAIFDDTTLSFQAPITLIGPSQAVTSNPYEHYIGVGLDGSLHLAWGYRTSAGSANTNFGLWYAKSMDKGVTFTSADGVNSYSIPLSDANAERIANLATGSGYVNQNGGCCDLLNNYHTVAWQYDANNDTQIQHIWFDGDGLKNEVVSKFNFKIDLTANLLDGSLSRPLIVHTRYGKTFVIYHANYMGRDHHIRAIDVSIAGKPIDFKLASFNIGYSELSINVNEVLKTNDLKMLLSRSQEGNTDLAAESAYLMTVSMP